MFLANPIWRDSLTSRSRANTARQGTKMALGAAAQDRRPLHFSSLSTSSSLTMRMIAPMTNGSTTCRLPTLPHTKTNTLVPYSATNKAKSPLHLGTNGNAGTAWVLRAKSVTWTNMARSGTRISTRRPASFPAPRTSPSSSFKTTPHWVLGRDFLAAADPLPQLRASTIAGTSRTLPIGMAQASLMSTPNARVTPSWPDTTPCGCHRWYPPLSETLCRLAPSPAAGDSPETCRY